MYLKILRFLLGEIKNLVKTITFTGGDVTAMLANLAAVCKRVHTLSLIRELAASHELEQMLRVRVREKAAAWKREDGFNRNEKIAERHQKTLRRLYVGDDPEPFQIEYTVAFNGRPPLNNSLWV